MIRLKPVIVLALAFLLCGLCPLGAYGGCDYYLYQPLQFADGKVQGCVRKHELESAFGRKVEIGTDNKSNDGYEFLWDGGERRKVENCNDYIKAKQRGGTAGTTFEISMESFFIHTCGALAGLKSSSVPKKDFVDVKTYPALEKFPVFLLPYLSGDQEAELLAASNAGKNLKEYAISKEIEINRKEKSFGVIWDDMERSFDLVAEGDFTGDGYAGLLVFSATHSSGTLRHYEYILLTMRDKNQKMYDVLSEDEGCLYEKGQYVCSPEQRWSALQKEELQPTH